jgi:hypothetical protein
VAWVREYAAANSAQAFDGVISTIRTASIRGFGGSTPNNVGGSPFSTQRQNFRSAVTDQVLIERIGMDFDLDPFAAAGNHRQDRIAGGHHEHIML